MNPESKNDITQREQWTEIDQFLLFAELLDMASSSMENFFVLKSKRNRHYLLQGKQIVFFTVISIRAMLVIVQLTEYNRPFCFVTWYFQSRVD